MKDEIKGDVYGIWEGRVPLFISGVRVPKIHISYQAYNKLLYYTTFS